MDQLSCSHLKIAKRREEWRGGEERNKVFRGGKERKMEEISEERKGEERQVDE